MFEFQNVSKQFGTTVALQSTTLQLQAEQSYVLLGTSGCGKSTMLKLMLGLLSPTTGTVLFDGTPLQPEKLDEVRRRIGYVIQEGGLFPHLSAFDNVALVSRYLKWDEERIRKRISELSHLVRLPEDSLTRFPGQLSGGQRQRVGLMRALMLDPSVLLLDEPLGALDPIIRFELQEDLRTIFRQLNKTVVMVTHDLNEACYFADEILLLDAGHIVQRGSIQQLVETPATDFVARFIKAQRSELPGANA
ncbi:MAG: ABC transporter ATP-binding protein [Planctomycetaceae bacterium]|nr:ABC transporter ATP-binding protein [Planctomycetaceae bacterium]MCB9952351.1 ABC transporter ATP-binding protein [Planctomycetaceae bacterium]